VNQAIAETECRQLLAAALQEADSGGDSEQLSAWEACVAHPCAPHVLPLEEVWPQIAELRRRAADWDGAIAAWERAIVAGYRSVPHPRANVAELLLSGGRWAEAADLYATLRAQCPGDVWLCVAAAWAYMRVDDHETALRWAGDGAELALATGDPDELLGELRTLRALSLRALGRGVHDELSQRMGSFVRPESPPASLVRGYGDPAPQIEACPYCGWEAPPAVAPTPLRSV
jgi:hypothetical protein